MMTFLSILIILTCMASHVHANVHEYVHEEDFVKIESINTRQDFIKVKKADKAKLHEVML